MHGIDIGEREVIDDSLASPIGATGVELVGFDPEDVRVDVNGIDCPLNIASTVGFIHISELVNDVLAHNCYSLLFCLLFHEMDVVSGLPRIQCPGLPAERSRRGLCRPSSLPLNSFAAYALPCQSPSRLPEPSVPPGDARRYATPSGSPLLTRPLSEWVPHRQTFRCVGPGSEETGAQT